MAPSQASEDVTSRSRVLGTKARNSQANPEQFSLRSLWGVSGTHPFSSEAVPGWIFGGLMES